MKKLLTIFFCMNFFSTASWGQDIAQAEHIHAKILSAQSGVGMEKELDMGVAVELEQGWYTYWRMPGETGLAPSFDWSKSENVKDVKIHWPAPKRFSTLDMYSFGYDKAFVLPLDVTVEETSKPVTLALKLDVVICHDICIPASLSLAKSLPAGNVQATDDHAVLKNARWSLPSSINTDGFKLSSAVLGKDAVVVTGFSREGFGPDTDMFVEAPGVMLTGKPEIIVDGGDAQNAVLKIKAPEGVDLSKNLFGKSATIVVTNGDEAIERSFTF